MRNGNDCQDQGERLQLLGQMSAGVVHDIRNMIGSLSLNLEFVESRLNGNSTMAEDGMERCFRILENLDSMLESVLELARAQSNVRRLDLGELVSQTLRMLGQKVRSHNVRLHSQIDRELFINGSPGELCQAISNLVINACEAMEGSTGPRTLTVTAAHRGDVVEVLVEDSGPGVDEEMRTVLFEAFRTNKARGTGLGLWNTQRIATDHGGEVTVCNRPEGGARFRLTLPTADRASLAHSA